MRIIKAMNEELEKTGDMEKRGENLPKRNNEFKSLVSCPEISY
jgi:hypothetical protein